jgi:hypothetical protein
MHIIVAGSRSFNDYQLLKARLDFFTQNQSEIVVISGCAKGADELGERWAAEKGHRVERFPANWSVHGKRAGFVRNVVMADHADAVVVFWDGESRGTKHMLELARKRGLPLRVVRY